MRQRDGACPGGLPRTLARPARLGYGPAMQLSLDSNLGPLVIRAYGPGYLVVNEERLEGSVILTAGEILRDWPPGSLEELQGDHFEELLAHGPEIVLLGTGARQRFPRPELLAPLIRQGVGYEIMDTPAACRTYNILAGEGRNVAAALLAIEDGDRSGRR